MKNKKPIDLFRMPNCIFQCLGTYFFISLIVPGLKMIFANVGTKRALIPTLKLIFKKFNRFYFGTDSSLIGLAAITTLIFDKILMYSREQTTVFNITSQNTEKSLLIG